MSIPYHTPSDNAEETIHSAILEMISGISSLHMPPNPREHDPEDYFLSDTDHNAAHTIEHIHHAIELLHVAIKQARKERGNK